MNQPKLSPTLREFLLEIYLLSERSGHTEDYFTSTDLLQIFYTSLTSLNRAIVRLKELGLLDHQPYHGIRLTLAGYEAALPLVRSYRIAEVFLHDVMGLEWSEVHMEAMSIFGSMRESVTQRMFELSHAPMFCPHGEPIPDINGHIQPMNDQLLYTAPLKTNLVITRVIAREPERLKYIAALRLIPGATLQVIHLAPFDGPLQLKLADEYRIIGHNLAEVIFVRVHDPD